ncbi:T9SS type A sorting domain-containing protein [Pinibacter soli]|uniref:T9SS type A sorting domain-containing protein n=1 Tax=Pinibacter soli TaxID=3044211 RepID=A0ABT6R6E3_9BACT|nr:T9SS type A sorting domain-containing protein [Pinibacter soli]MDI3318145.1 T9SS type A sorting domain-containing protein [Pinibacter soli]
MKIKLYPLIKLALPLIIQLVLVQLTFSQECSSLKATTVTTESRCTATGSIEITATGGSNNYNYRVDGPVTTSYTSSRLLTGLSAGTYTVYVKDIVKGCEITVANVVVSGSYSDPRFALSKTDVTCKNGSDGTISVTGAVNGRTPFIYSIIAPSPSSVGVTNTSGNFTNLLSGEYVVQLQDSCGGKQTRRITILNYDWWIDSQSITNAGCDLVNVAIGLKDNKGNTSGSGTLFSGFRFGYTLSKGDTTFVNSPGFSFHLANKRSAVIVVKDPCGNIQTINWTNNLIPSLAANVTTTPTCKTFTAQVTGQVNFTSPTQYKLYNSSNQQIASNTTGTFAGLDYGTYKVTAYDACFDTTITRTFTATPIKPSVNATVSVSGKQCSTFDATVTGQSSLSSPQFYLYDKNGTQVANNTTGAFTAIPYGSYSIKIKDACYDTTITLQFAQAPTQPSVNANATISNQKCTTFSATASGNNLSNPLYCLVDLNGNQIGTCLTTPTFDNMPYGDYKIKVTNSASCYDTTMYIAVSGKRKKPTVGSYGISNKDCNGFTLTITGTTNLTNPLYCLYDDGGNQVGDCNTTGKFTNVPYGHYYIKIKNDATCYDTTLVNEVTVARNPMTKGNYTISNLTCSGFKVVLSGATNLNNPTFCLYDGNGNQVGDCNATGVFDNVPYGSYCIKIKNDPGCYDTTMMQCFTQSRPVPAMGTYTLTRLCATFDVKITGSTSVNNPVYTLVDANGNQVGTTNTTGIFTGIPYGKYCVLLKNDPSCYDTTMQTCFTASRLLPSAGQYTLNNQGCTGFDAAISGSSNLTNPTYTLYDANGNQVGTSATGDFTNIPYGSYSVKIQNDPCYDTSMTRYFAAAHPMLSVNQNVNITKGCASMDVKITGQTNLTNPTYTLYDKNGNQFGTQNTTGTFTAIPYGDYCIMIKDGCYDTTIKRCFSMQPNPISISLSAAQSCAIGATNIKVVFGSGSSPYTVTVYDPYGDVVTTQTSTSKTVMLNNLPGLDNNKQYTIIGSDKCSVADTAKITPVTSYVNRNITFQSKCPTAQWENGAALINITTSSNLGTATPTIISKNGTATTINYSITTGNGFQFVDIEPASYILEYAISGCTGHVYDTVTVAPYAYPSLAQSAAYQCDNNSFSVGASPKGGIGPFTYEVIGSSPEFPSIVAPPQSNPVFTFNNGVEYSLVRLRAVDACGNATLNDVNILPLANSIVTASANCFYKDVILSVDTVANATFEWYKINTNTDSTLVGTGTKLHMPALMPDEAGVYVSKMSVNSGCLTKLAYFNVTGDCNGVLSMKVTLSGKQNDQGNQLSWVANSETNVQNYIIERSVFGSDNYIAIATASAKNTNASSRYAFVDKGTSASVSNYRVRVVEANGNSTFTNKITIKKEDKDNIVVMPNPVTTEFNVSITGKKTQNYQLSLYNVAGQCVFTKQEVNIQTATLKYERGNIRPGIYVLRVYNTSTGVTTVTKVLFQ